MKKLKVIAAMSGGVDSAVAAARAVDAGYEVVGVHLALSSNPQKYRSGARGCCNWYSFLYLGYGRGVSQRSS